MKQVHKKFAVMINTYFAWNIFRLRTIFHVHSLQSQSDKGGEYSVVFLISK